MASPHRARLRIFVHGLERHERFEAHLPRWQRQLVSKFGPVGKMVSVTIYFRRGQKAAELMRRRLARYGYCDIRMEQVRGTSMNHRCAIAGCPTTVPQRLLMCSAHWSRVPADLRKEVKSAWDKLWSSEVPESEEHGVLMRYRAARQQAIAAVQEQLACVERFPEEVYDDDGDPT